MDLFKDCKNKQVFILCEKPSQARSYASCIGCKSNTDGFPSNGSNIVVGHARGHLVELFHLYDYEHTFDLPIPYTPKVFKFKNSGRMAKSKQGYKHIPDADKKKLLQTISKHMKNADVIINACDSGSEGENIFYKIHDFISINQKIYRLWVDSMDPGEIKKGFSNLKDAKDYAGLRYYARGREIADWMLGINGSRKIGACFSHKFRLGRVQSPVLAEIIKRELDVKNHVVTYFYRGYFISENIKVIGHTKCDTADEAKVIADSITDPMTCTDVTQKKKSTKPPKLFSLATLQSYMNSHYGMGLKQTLSGLQDLYDQGYLSYPRTESEYITQSMFSATCSLANTITKGISGLDVSDYNASTNLKRCVDDSKVEDHYAIIPTDKGVAKFINTGIDSVSFSRDKDLFFVVCRRFIENCYPAYTANVKKFLFKGSKDTFSCSEIIPIDLGWKKVGGVSEKEDGDDVASNVPFVKGKSYKVTEKDVLETENSKPSLYTEATILKFMLNPKNADLDSTDKAILKDIQGIGTPATRTVILDNLDKNGYITKKKKSLVGTDVGHSLYTIIKQLFIGSVDATVMLEKYLRKIKEDSNPQGACHMFEKELEKLTTKLCEQVDKAEGGAAVPRAVKKGPIDDGVPLGTCPKCNKGNVLEWADSFRCDSKIDGEFCDFIIWKTICKHTFVKEDVPALLAGKPTESLSLTSKNNKTFKAYFIVENGKLEMKYVNDINYEPINDTPVALCPKCKKSQLSEGEKFVFCSDNTCKYILFKTFAGRTFSIAEIKAIVSGKGLGQTDGFISKTGRPFSVASVTLNEKLLYGLTFNPRK